MYIYTYIYIYINMHVCVHKLEYMLALAPGSTQCGTMNPGAS